MRTPLLALVVAAAAVAAGAAAATTDDRGTATITTGAGTRVVLQVEIARTVPERQQGLMHRRSLPAKAGMVFVYPRDVRSGFWMKNTLIPLDVAFSDARGRILRILTMQPCRADPCRIYEPDVSYRTALEVNAGSFRRWKVKAGDRVTVRTARAG